MQDLSRLKLVKLVLEIKCSIKKQSDLKSFIKRVVYKSDEVEINGKRIKMYFEESKQLYSTA